MEDNVANPNILNITTITGITTALTPSTTTNVVLLANTTSSNKVFKINTLVAANIDGANAIDCTVTLYSNGAQAQGSAPSGGAVVATLASTISVPADASLIVIDKSTGIYLQENVSVVVTSGVASKINYVVSYEEMW